MLHGFLPYSHVSEMPGSCGSDSDLNTIYPGTFVPKFTLRVATIREKKNNRKDECYRAGKSQGFFFVIVRNLDSDVKVWEK